MPRNLASRSFVVKSLSGRQTVVDLSLFSDDSVAHRITDSESAVIGGVLQPVDLVVLSEGADS